MTKLLRVTALVKMFIETARGQRPGTVEVTAQELRAEEKRWINTIQANNFKEERKHLLGINSKMVLLVKHFGLFLDEEGTIRCRGRIDKSSLSLSAKQPVLLPTKHYVTEFIIRKSHEFVHHNGIKETLNNKRESYWILRGRETVKRVVRNCVVSKKFEGKPFGTPTTAQLPTSRVSDEPLRKYWSRFRRTIMCRHSS